MIRPPSIDEVLLSWKALAPKEPSQPNSKKQKIDPQQTKINILNTLKNFSTYSPEDYDKIESLKAEVRSSGDTDFLQRIERATKRLQLGIPHRRFHFGLDSLPTDLLMRIFSFIRDKKSRKAIHTTCRQFASLLNNPNYLSDIIGRSELKLTFAELAYLLPKCGHKVTSFNLANFMRDKISEPDTEIGHLVATILKECPNLLNLSIGGRSVVEDNLRELTNLQQLTTLNLQGAHISEDFLPKIASLQNLQHLKMYNYVSKPFVIGLIFNLRNLERFDAHNARFSNSDLIRLSKNFELSAENLKKTGHQLQPFKLTSLDLTDFEGVEFPFELSRFQALTELNLNSATITTLNGISLLSNITDLNCSHSDIRDACMDEVLTLSKLRTLKISYTNLTDQGVKNISRLTNLESFHPSDKLTAEGYKEIGQLLNLRVLIIKEGEKPITPESMKEISKLSNLLELEFCTQTVSVLREMSKISSLTSLSMHNSKFEDIDYSSVPFISLPFLSRIDLGSTNIDDNLLRSFKFSQLSSIHLYNTKVTDLCVDQLIECSRLVEVFLVGSKITVIGKKRLVEGLPYLQRLFTNFVTEKKVPIAELNIPNL